MYLSEASGAILDVLKSGGAVSFVTAGVSMVPTLRDRRDKVTLTGLSKPPRKNDIVLYTRADGSFVLHRVVGRDRDGYILRGDNQWVNERGVAPRQIIAAVRSIERNGKTIECAGLRFRLYGAALPAVRFFRKNIYPIYVRLISIFLKQK
ncbi:MAG: S24/S26 family peptidase [Oscillospiraceae bacterium]|nr:S24/S26 family peptidase [Oscillospiraceae bacterium]